MGSQKRSESSSSSEYEKQNVHESDESSGDFKVLNVSRKLSQWDEGQRNDLSEENPPSPGEATKADLLAQCAGDCSRARSTIGGARLKQWISSVRKGSSENEKAPNFTKMIRKNKNFHNPAIFAKMISYCNINEFGTQFKNRRALRKGEFYTDIADVQDFCMKGSS